jgi:signal transduction histidine kinase
MKPGILLFIAGMALALLIAVQVYLISGLYDLKKETIEERYREVLLDGFPVYQQELGGTGFDSAFFYLDRMAVDLMDDYFLAGDDSSRMSLNRWVITRLDTLLQRYDQLTPFLKEYLVYHGLDSTVSVKIVPAGFSFLYPDEEITLLPSRELPLFLNGRKSFFLLNNYRVEQDFFRLSFGYYADVTRRQRTVLREMTAALLLSLLSILITAVIFFITLRNLMRHRQLSMMKTDVINNMAHELKTPLTTIAVAGSTLAQPDVQQDPEQVKRLSGLIRSENRHLGRLIDQLLDINVWERDNITLQLKETDIGPLLQKIADAFRLEHKERTFTLETEIDAALEGVKVRLDEFYFSVALHNLLSNALKYGGDPPRIGMKAFVERDLLVVEVADNGRGIPPEEQKHLFEKFYRGRAARKHIRGLGLGLFYVKKILEMHGGDVILTESTAKGSVFRIVLPLKNIQA